MVKYYLNQVVFAGWHSAIATMTTEQLALIEGIPNETIEDRENSQRRIAFEVNELGALPFSGAYEMLRAEGWYYVDAAFIAWKSLPKKVRYPTTIEKLANSIGVSGDTIKKRRQKNPRIDERANKALLTGSLLPQMDGVIDALMESAADPSYKHHADRKLALEMSGLYTPKQAIDLGVTANKGNEAEQSEDQLRQIAEIGGES